MWYNRGKLRANGEDDVEENPQKTKIAEIARPMAKTETGEDILSSVLPSSWRVEEVRGAGAARR